MNAAPVWELSGWWRRVGAYIIDSILLSLAAAALIAVGFVSSGASFFNDNDEPSDGILLPMFFLGVLVLPTIYYCWMMSATNGQTVGKQALDIRVVREDGLAVDALFAFKRQILVINLLFGLVLGFFLFGLPQLIDYLWPLWDSKNQALHDKIVKSRVVMASEVAPGQSGEPPQPYFSPGQQTPPAPAQPGEPYYGQLPAPGQPQFPQAPAGAPPPPSAPPPPPAPSSPSKPYTPPPGFENPVPEDKND